MPIRFPCIACGQQFTVKTELAGMKSKCPKCGTIVVVPSGAVPRPQHIPVLTQSVDQTPAEPIKAVATAPPRKRRGYLTIALVAILLIVGAGSGWYYYSEFVNTPEAAAKRFCAAMEANNYDAAWDGFDATTQDRLNKKGGKETFIKVMRLNEGASEKMMATAVFKLRNRDGDNASVLMEYATDKGKPKSDIIEMKREGGAWKVVMPSGFLR